MHKYCKWCRFNVDNVTTCRACGALVYKPIESDEKWEQLPLKSISQLKSSKHTVKPNATPIARELTFLTEFVFAALLYFPHLREVKNRQEAIDHITRKGSMLGIELNSNSIDRKIRHYINQLKLFPVSQDSKFRSEEYQNFYKLLGEGVV